METGMISSTPAATAATSGSATATAKNTLDKDSFLKLLVAQLKNQDPTSAGQDPNQMIQQLTSFSSLEQAQQTNTLLTGLQTQTSGLFQAQAASLVGKTVTVDGSGFYLKSGAASMNVVLDSAASVTAVIKDSTGKAVRTLDAGNLNAGANTLSWDGHDTAGNLLPDGSYQVTVTATGANGKAVPFTSNLTLKVDSLAFKDGGIFLTSGGNNFALTNVLGITA